VPEVNRFAGLLLFASLTHGACAATPEQIVGGIDAVVFACTTIDPKSAKAGSELLERARVQRKLDLTLIRSTDTYKTTYNAEVNRLLALPPKERQAACQSAW
jgi:hypothetical protein